MRKILRFYDDKMINDKRSVYTKKDISLRVFFFNDTGIIVYAKNVLFEDPFATSGHEKKKWRKKSDFYSNQIEYNNNNVTRQDCVYNDQL